MTEKIPLFREATNVRTTDLNSAMRWAFEWIRQDEGTALDIEIRYLSGATDMIREITVWRAGDKP